MSTSDSSEDENLELLREAACTEFLKDSLFNSTNYKAGKTKASSNEESQHVPSLRLGINKDDQFNSLNVTPQFQEHIAKKLSEILDKKLANMLTTKSVNSARKRKKSGIRLFSNSTKCIKLNKRKVMQREVCSNFSDNSDNETKCREVAVSPDDILSKNDVRNWSSRTKGEVFRYTTSGDGSLVSVD